MKLWKEKKEMSVLKLRSAADERPYNVAGMLKTENRDEFRKPFKDLPGWK